MSDGFDKLSQATGLPVGVSRELRMFFDMSQDKRFVKAHNERLARRWDATKPDHEQYVFALFNVRVTMPTELGDMGGIFKPLGSTVLHHQFFFQAEKELEYWALKYLGCRVRAEFFARHYLDGRWVYIETKTMQLDIPGKGSVVRAANDAAASAPDNSSPH